MSDTSLPPSLMWLCSPFSKVPVDLVVRIMFTVNQLQLKRKEHAYRCSCCGPSCDTRMGRACRRAFRLAPWVIVFLQIAIASSAIILMTAADQTGTKRRELHYMCFYDVCVTVYLRRRFRFNHGTIFWYTK